MLHYLNRHKESFFVGFLLVILIPIFLNIILQCKICDFVIAKDGDGPSTWLVFWGAFLSAIGAFCMALVSYTQNRNQSKVELKRTELNTLESRFDKAYMFVKDLIETCNPSIFLEIIRLYNTDTEKAHAYCLKQTTHIYPIQHGVLQFISHKNSSSNSFEEEFFQNIRQEYERLSNIYDKLKEIIIDKEQGKVLKEVYIESITTRLYSDLFEVIRRVNNIGFDFLLGLRKEIEDKQKEINQLYKTL